LFFQALLARRSDAPDPTPPGVAPWSCRTLFRVAWAHPRAPVSAGLFRLLFTGCALPVPPV